MPRATNVAMCSLSVSFVLSCVAATLPAAGAETARLYWILLASQPQEEIVRRVERSAELQLSLFEGRLRAAEQAASADAARLELAHRQWIEAQREVRAAAFAEIERALAPEQEAVRARVEALGGRVQRRYLSINLLLAELTPSAAEELARDERVARVWLDPGPQDLGPAPGDDAAKTEGESRHSAAEVLQTAQAVPLPLAIGAGPLWDQGINGRGEWIALMGPGVNVSHPMFRGLRIEGEAFLRGAQGVSGFADDTSYGVDRIGTGTALASLLVGQGMAGGWEHYRGIAWGAAGLLVLKSSYRRLRPDTQTYTEFFVLSDALDAWEWLVSRRPEIKIVAAPNPSFSEHFATAFGLFVPMRTGRIAEAQQTRPNRESEIAATPVPDNEGGSPSLLTVATTDHRNTVDPADDAISPFSARGPTTDGRRKPDVAAPGTNFWGARHDGDTLVKFDNVTRPAADLIAGAGALLRQAGVQNATALKALFINTASRSQWDKEWGWGSVDLQRAYAQRRAVVTGEVASGASAYYRFTAQGQTSATLAWTRRIDRGTTSDANWPGCQANLDLRLYQDATGGLLGASSTPNDSVERVIVNASGSVIARVSYTGPACRASEPFALAVSSDTPPSRLSGPTLASSCSEPPQVVAGQPFTITCTLRNTGDLGVTSANATLQLGGASVAQIGFGNIAAGASSVRSVTVNAPAAAGRTAWRLDVTAMLFDEQRTAAASGSLDVVAAGTATRPVLAITPAQIFVQARATDAPVTRTVRISNSGTGSLSWTASASHAWLQISPASGSGPADLAVTVQPASLPAGISVGFVTISVAGLPAQSLTVFAELIGPPAAPGPSITSVVNGASFTEGFAPASWVTIRGSRLAPTTRIWRAEDFVAGQLPTNLDGVRVNIGGRAAPVYYISPEQLNVLAPDDDAEGPVQIEVITSEGRAVTIAERRRVAPGIFTYSAGGRSFVAAVHAGYPVESKRGILVAPEGIIPGYPTLPATPGDYIQLYVTGLGLNLNPRPTFGRVFEGAPELLDEVRVWIGGQPVTVQWKGLVGPGLYQINFVTPELPGGEYPVEIQVGGSPRVRSGGSLPVAR
ncbi:MAG: S8 family serine peptidase [Bryobacteraceae bacterium]|nr:S8 family serine peptidase [Bryobacteraceae bacterium]